MRGRHILWFLVCLLCVLAAGHLWRRSGEWQARKTAATSSVQARPKVIGMAGPQSQAAAASPILLLSQPKPSNPAKASTPKERFPYRLSNTAKTLKQLERSEKAIILGNALIDTEKPATLAIPDRLRAPPNNDSYIVQSRGALDEAFRNLLRDAGASIISYIPNNAYLVRVSASGADQISADQRAQSVLPWEPYYKLEPPLLKLAMEQQPVPADSSLKLTLFPGERENTLAALNALQADVVGEDRSPFGPVLKVNPAADTLTDLARLPGVQRIERAHSRFTANDLSRVRLGVSNNTTNLTNYLGLTGTNVMVNVNDSGADVSHPDLTNRITGDLPGSLVDVNGHGTHVIGTIAGSGAESATVTNASGSVTNANFRGMAPGANIFVMSVGFNTGPLQSEGFPPPDAYLQEQAARTNALISNNSWNYTGDGDYDIAAASYDAAVRDALPFVTGPQPLVYVFSAGNTGAGDDSGFEGNPESVLSPGTAKNVITVGAIEQPRNITNVVVARDGSTNTPFLPSTDASDEVAGFSSRGNVGIGIEGDSGRFKPDLVAPGTFVVSDRSSQWDQQAYFNPTNVHFFPQLNQVVETNALYFTFFPVPDNTVQFIVSVSPNHLSPSPFSDVTIYLKNGDLPTTTSFDVKGTNQVSLPPDGALAAPATWFIGVADPTSKEMRFDLGVELVTTNDNGNYLQVFSNLDNNLGPFYRYESGTSMAAAGVSGMLALMEEFFEQRLQLTNSPALMKALLINGARSLNTSYNLQVRNQINYQGWGLANLINSLPAALSNYNTAVAGLPLQFFDQSTTNALATGQSKTRTIALTPEGQNQPLRITLVWTDPPGNPAAGLKLVNDLDLIVTNLETGDVFYGNDIPAGSVFNVPWDTNSPPNVDLVNNVENVFLNNPLGTNYSVTVLAHHVNVNAVTANTNNVVQDYALVISSGDGGVLTNAFTVTDTPIVSTNQHLLTVVTNGLPLLGQRIGANSQYASTTNGITNQWNFYVFTNTLALTNSNFKNVAFVTFLPPNLSLPRMGPRAVDLQNSSRIEADIDLYVSTNPALTNLDPVVVAAADKSLSRTGTEKVLYTNSVGGEVYYIGVKSEDQEGAEYGFLGVATDIPFGQRTNGNIIVTFLSSFPVPIPDGSPSNPGVTNIIGLTTEQGAVRRAVVTNWVSHQDFGDLLGTVTHGQKFAVLNNHSLFDNNAFQDPNSITNFPSEIFVYDDSGEGDLVGHATTVLGHPVVPRPTDGPGSLRNFVGEQANEGLWIVTMVDDALTHTGQVNNVVISLEPESQTNGFTRTILANSWFYDFIDVPADATNLTVLVSITGGSSGPVELFVRRGDFPDLAVFDASAVIPPAPGLSITKSSSPPLNPGRYFIGVHNPTATAVQVRIVKTLGEDAKSVQPLRILSKGDERILDDAVTYSTNYVGVTSHVAQVEVGVRIDHPRVSDLALTLISPQGTRVLLVENRGWSTTNGYGTGINITNVLPVTTSGNAAAETNVISAGTNGTLIINYDFFVVPDTMHIYYDGVRIFDSGLINGSGSFTVDYGPGISNNIVIIMNEGGNPNETEWTYTVTEITRQIIYATFTENTNLTTTPIKFALPPFGGTNGASISTLFSDFELSATGDYTNGATVDGWSVLTNKVTVQTGAANSGVNYLSLRDGRISRTLPMTAGSQYGLAFAYRRSPALNPIHWWPAERNANDIINGNNGTFYGGSYAPGEVGSAFQFQGANLYVAIPGSPSLDVGASNAFTIDCWINPANVTTPQPLIEWNKSSGFVDGAHLWLSVSWTNDGTGGPGSIYMNLVDTAGNYHQLSSAPGIVSVNTWQHVAMSYDKTTGFAKLSYNGTVVANAFLGSFTPQTFSPLYFGARVAADVTFYSGLLDEVGIYNQVLTDAQIQDIYLAGSLGRCGTLTPPTVCPTPEANAVIDGTQAATVTGTNYWQNKTLLFTASQNGTTLEMDAANNPSGLLLDSFSLFQPGQSTNYYLPEESLNQLVGENARGDWLLEVVDNRAGATNPAPTLISWQLSLVLDTVVPFAIPLTHAIPQTNTVSPFDIRYFLVDVPAWASFATNTLFNVSGPVNLLFNQGAEPTGGSPGDFTLINNSAGGIALLTTNGTPPLVPGQRYYLGVQNLGAAPVSFGIEVDFDITPLTNAVPLTSSIAAIGQPRYFQYDVSTNAAAVSFQILNPSGNVDLVARRGPPLPDLISHDYISANPGANNEAIVVSSNSAPVALRPGRWYLGVFNQDVATVNYTIIATEIGPPTIIVLTNGIPFNYVAAPGPAVTNFFRFDITQTNAAALFELYNLSGNVDLTLQRDAFPYSAPFAGGSFNSVVSPEQIVIRTNILGTNINAQWFLGVPNNETRNVTYTIRAVVSANGLLISALPFSLGIAPPTLGSGTGPILTWTSVMGETYQVQVSTDLITWTVLATIAGTGETTIFIDPTPVTGVPQQFYRIVQVPTP